MFAWVPDPKLVTNMQHSSAGDFSVWRQPFGLQRQLLKPIEYWKKHFVDHTTAYAAPYLLITRPRLITPSQCSTTV